MEVLIVGSGAIGQWFGTFVPDPVYTDIDPHMATTAAAVTGGRTVSLDDDITPEVVCIAVPMTDAEAAIEQHAPKATEAILDLTGAMTGPIAAMNRYAPTIERGSFHPLFAPENAPGRIAVVVDAGGPRLDAIQETLARNGNSLFETTPDEHDTVMETIQAKTHTAILAFALAADEVPPEYGTPVYDRLWDLVTELTNGTPRVYADIQETFDGASDIATAAERIATADRASFEQLYREARE